MQRFEIGAKDGESVSVFTPFARKEVEIERKKLTIQKEGHDVKEKPRMVIERLVSERRLEVWTTVRWRQSKLSRTVDKRDSARIKVERDHKLPV